MKWRLDATSEQFYTNEQVQQIAAAAAQSALMAYQRDMNLDNGKSQAVIDAPLMEGTDSAMAKYRTAIEINGVKCWIEGTSLQDFANHVLKKCEAEQPVLHKATRTFESYALEWMEVWEKPKIKVTTFDNYSCDLKNHIFPVLGEMQICDIREADIQRVFTSLIDKNLSKSKAHQIQTILHQVFSAAIHDDLYHRPNPTEDRRLVLPRKQGERRPLEDSEIQSALHALDTLPPDLACILALTLMLGERRSEMLGLRWEDIDEKGGFIHLRQVNRLTRGRAIISTDMKSKKADRRIALVPQLMKYLGNP